jgi:flagellar basal body P-ring formation protein FlgA
VRRTVALGLVLVCVLLAIPAAAASPVIVRLASDGIAQGDEILLSEIADVQGDGPLAERVRALRVAPAPPVGLTLPVPVDTVRARLGADAARVQVTGATRVLVMRATQTVRAADLIDAVRGAARARLTALESRGEPVALTPISRPGDIRVPAGDLRLDVRLHEGAATAPTLAATVTVRVNGHERHHVVLTFQLTRLVDVIVLTRSLEPRRVLAADDFRRERRPAGEVPPDALADLAEPADHELLRAAQAGEVLTPRVIRPRVVVKRGELVTLLLEGQGFRITTQAQASEDARRGDAVRVLNVSSKREVVGVAEGSGVVRVPYRSVAVDR